MAPEAAPRLDHHRRRFTVLFIAINLLSYRASGAAREALGSDDAVEVTRTAASITFTPRHQRQGTAVLFFSGALVDPAAYAPLMRRLAEHGHVAVLVPLPARTAPTERHEQEAVTRALAIMNASPSRRWIVGGHSKGAAIASLFAREHPRSLAGLLLVGSSHPREFNLSALEAPVLKVYGSRDGLASGAEIRQFASNLPAQTRFVEIKGGNHAQFGYYGFQFGDKPATISRSQQQTQLFEAILNLLQQIAASPAAQPAVAGDGGPTMRSEHSEGAADGPPRLILESLGGR